MTLVRVREHADDFFSTCRGLLMTNKVQNSNGSVQEQLHWLALDSAPDHVLHYNPSDGSAVLGQAF